MSRSVCLGALAALALAACGETRTGGTCDERTKIEGLCPGVDLGAVCRGAFCAEGVSCSSVVEVSKPAGLADAAAGAAAGTCLALGEGDYPAVALPAGVSLLGKSAGQVTLSGVRSEGGTLVLRGVTVGGDGVRIDGPGRATFERVRVTGTSGTAVLVDGADVTMTESTVESNQGFGFAARCAEGCTCAKPPAVRLTSVRLAANQDVGVWLFGVDATLEGVHVVDTGPKDFQRGRGVEAGGCSTVSASQMLVEDNADVGVFLHESSATLGPDVGLLRNVRGIQIQSLAATHSVVLDGFEIAENKAVGVGADDGAVGIVIQNGRIADTALHAVPVTPGGTEDVGDGISWAGGSSLDVAASVVVSASGRVPALIDASSTGRFAGTLEGGDETVGIVIQNGSTPEVAPGVTTQTRSDVLPVAAPVAAKGLP